MAYTKKIPRVSSRTVLRLDWPKPKQDATPIVPVFLPYAACPERCIFCAQDVQSNTQPQSVSTRLAQLTLLHQALRERHARSAAPVEIAFYGGTFTALPKAERTAYLAWTRTALTEGIVVRARCSTRPDAVSLGVLHELRASGFTTVELGVQSFDTDALQSSRRGYDTETAQRACALVREAGLQLGIQLLPGMPGVSPEIFVQDVRTALAMRADMVRFYPCQVLENTPLAAMWRAGAYTPWTLPHTITALAQGWRLAHKAGVPVIRMGLAPEDRLQHSTLAGPTHPSLGALVQGTALHTAVAQMLHAPVKMLHAPRWTQGYFWGHKGALRHAWARLGISPATVVWHTTDAIHAYS